MIEGSKDRAEGCFAEIKEDKERITEELKVAQEELTTKDAMVKTLTKENLNINSRVT